MRFGSDPRSLARRPSDPAELLGQVLTPRPLAQVMARTLLGKRPRHPIAILDPAVGPATFPMALTATGLLKAQDELSLFDIDQNMVDQATAWATKCPCRCHVILGDYLESGPSKLFDLVILNPPYVRQEWLEKKDQYREHFRKQYGAHIPGTANLYVYFLVKAVQDLKRGGHISCIVYDSWQSTRFGAWLSAFLEKECDSIERIPVEGQPFQGRLIDATILYARRRTTPRPLEVQVSGLSGEEKPAGPFSTAAGFVPVDILLKSNRGLRLKQTDFFRGDLKLYLARRQ